ncbi:MAG: hypothetical protein PHW01_00845 [Patescibacteria group bacterium]|nr:hypothetical protein [Patescibacteria group bacterium]
MMFEATFKAQRIAVGSFPVSEITVHIDEKGCFVNGKKAKMSYNGIQLRFELEEDIYITFNDTNPGRPIAKIYEELGGKIESPRLSSGKKVKR